MGVPASGHRRELDRCVLHCALYGRISGEHVANSSGSEFLPVGRRGAETIFSGRDDSSMLLVNLVLDVSAQTVPKDLGPFLWRGLRSVCTCLAPVYGSDGNFITIKTLVTHAGHIFPPLRLPYWRRTSAKVVSKRHRGCACSGAPERMQPRVNAQPSMLVLVSRSLLP